MLSTMLLIKAIQADRHRDLQRVALIRAVGEGRTRNSTWSRLRTRVLDAIRPDHSLTDYPCRLPDGKQGRVAAIVVDGEWTLVCRAA